jgi:hypothetical protein
MFEIVRRLAASPKALGFVRFSKAPKICVNSLIWGFKAAKMPF